MSINAYKQMADPDGGKRLSRQVLNSVTLYMTDLQNIELDWGTRCDAGIAAITLLHEMSNNIRDDLPEEQQIILIKVFGQVIRNINKCIRGEVTDLSKELAGIRLIHKLIS